MGKSVSLRISHTRTDRTPPCTPLNLNHPSFSKCHWNSCMLRRDKPEQTTDMHCGIRSLRPSQLFNWLINYLAGWLSFYMSVRLCIYLSVCMSVYVCPCPYIYLCLYSYVCLFNCILTIALTTDPTAYLLTILSSNPCVSRRFPVIMVNQ